MKTKVGQTKVLSKETLLKNLQTSWLTSTATKQTKEEGVQIFSLNYFYWSSFVTHFERPVSSGGEKGNNNHLHALGLLKNWDSESSFLNPLLAYSYLQRPL